MSSDPLLSKVIGGCLLERRLGQGGMGVVYKATQISLHRPVAVKILNEMLGQNTEYISRFKREAQIVAQITHPNIIQIYDLGYDTSTNIYYFIMEYIEGENLGKILKIHHTIAEKEVVEIGIRVTSALAAAYEKQVIHRDIKPENIIITLKGEVKVADFGLAKNTGENAILTHTGEIMGTPAYLSPEQGQGSPVDHRSDIYSLGVTLFHLATGRRPYEGETPISFVIKHITSPIPDPQKISPNISSKISFIIQKMMAKQPDDRYQDYGPMISDLSEIRDQKTTLECLVPNKDSDLKPGSTYAKTASLDNQKLGTTLEKVGVQPQTVTPVGTSSDPTCTLFPQMQTPAPLPTSKDETCTLFQNHQKKLQAVISPTQQKKQPDGITSEITALLSTPLQSNETKHRDPSVSQTVHGEEISPTLPFPSQENLAREISSLPQNSSEASPTLPLESPIQGISSVLQQGGDSSEEKLVEPGYISNQTQKTSPRIERMPTEPLLRKESRFSGLKILILLIILGVVGASGWYIYHISEIADKIQEDIKKGEIQHASSTLKSVEPFVRRYHPKLKKLEIDVRNIMQLISLVEQKTQEFLEKGEIQEATEELKKVNLYIAGSPGLNKLYLAVSGQEDSISKTVQEVQELLKEGDIQKVKELLDKIDDISKKDCRIKKLSTELFEKEDLISKTIQDVQYLIEKGETEQAEEKLKSLGALALKNPELKKLSFKISSISLDADFSDCIQKAEEFIKNKKFSEASFTLKKANDIRKDEISLQCLQLLDIAEMARQSFLKKDYKRAIEEYNELIQSINREKIKSSPLCSRIFSTLIFCIKEEIQTVYAYEYKIIQENTEKAIEDKEYIESNKLINSYIEQYPNSIYCKDAQELLRRLDSEKTRYYKRLLDEGKSYIKEQNYKEALSRLRKAYSINPDDIEGISNLVKVLFFQKEYNEIEKYLKTLSEEKRFDILLTLGEYGFTTKEFVKARSFLQESLELSKVLKPDRKKMMNLYQYLGKTAHHFYKKSNDINEKKTVLEYLNQYRELGGKDEDIISLLIDLTDYFPLKENNQWKYFTKIRNAEKIRSYKIVKSEKRIDGERFLVEIDGMVQEAWFLERGYIIKQSLGGFQTKEKILPYPIRTRLVWENKGRIQVWQCEIVSIDDTVRVGAGDFNHCIKVRSTQVGAPNKYEEYYYAPGVGEVRRISVENNETYFRQELERYDVK